MSIFDFQPRTRVIYGMGSLQRLGEVSRELGFRRCLLVSDHGLAGSAPVETALRLLREAGIEVFPFHDFDPNPDSAMIEAGRDLARDCRIDSLVGLGGGSSLDCAKGINFLFSCGGRIQDYWGYGKASGPMLPMVGLPTTTGSGSEAQSYTLISNAETGQKMACGDPQAAFRVAILDPELALTQPSEVYAAAGLDALAHAIESRVTTCSTPWSDLLAREAWRLLHRGYPRGLDNPADREACADMMLGAHYAGMAIENSMLGAAHACANPLTANYGVTHGVAVALCLPHVVRWNGPAAESQYRELLSLAGFTANGNAAQELACRLDDLIRVSRLPGGLRALQVPQEDLPRLAEQAAAQWTGRFNPRPFGREGALEIYQWAY